MLCGVKLRFVNTTGKIAVPGIAPVGYILKYFAIYNSQLSYTPNPLKNRMV